MISKPLAAFLLRRHLKVQLLCALGPVIIGFVLGKLQPLFQKELPLLLKLAKTFEPIIKKFSPMDTELLLSPAGAFALPLLHPLTLVGYAVVGCLMPIALPAGARTTGALQVLLATPLDRGRLARTVFVATLPGALVMSLAPLVGIRVAVEAAGLQEPLPWSSYGALCSCGFMVIMTYCGLATLISVLASNRGRATLFYASTIAVFLLLEMAGRMDEDLFWIAQATPLGWYPVQDLLAGDQAHVGVDLAVLGGVMLTLLVSAVLAAVRRRSA